jgi:hypothetical protein
MRREDVIVVFWHGIRVVFIFFTRDPDSWLKSTYKPNLRRARRGRYVQPPTRRHLDLTGAKAVADAVTGTVYTVDLRS